MNLHCALREFSYDACLGGRKRSQSLLQLHFRGFLTRLPFTIAPRVGCRANTEIRQQIVDFQRQNAAEVHTDLSKTNLKEKLST